MSMYVNFRIRTPASIVIMHSGRVDYVPRVGETVSMNDRTRDVLSVDYDLSKNSITIELSN